MEYENKETTMLSDGRYLIDHDTKTFRKIDMCREWHFVLNVPYRSSVGSIFAKPMWLWGYTKIGN